MDIHSSLVNCTDLIREEKYNREQKQNWNM